MVDLEEAYESCNFDKGLGLDDFNGKIMKDVGVR